MMAANHMILEEEEIILPVKTMRRAGSIEIEIKKVTGPLVEVVVGVGVDRLTLQE